MLFKAPAIFPINFQEGRVRMEKGKKKSWKIRRLIWLKNSGVVCERIDRTYECLSQSTVLIIMSP